MFPCSIAFTVFDLETTGLDPLKGDRIVEISGVRVENGNIDEHNTFTSLVNPERGVPPHAALVHNIGDDLRLAPPIEEALPAFLSFAGRSILVAHNASFDRSFLLREKEFCWGYMEIPECLCTLALSKSVFPRDYGHNLDAALRRAGLDTKRRGHRALSDAILTARLLLRLVEIGRISSLQELREKARVKRSVGKGGR